MHKVTPQIKPITASGREKLGSVTVFTLWNDGSTNAYYGFGDVKVKLKPGQTVTFDAGANTVFASSAELVIEFDGGESSNNLIVMQFNTLTSVSRIFNDAIEK